MYTHPKHPRSNRPNPATNRMVEIDLRQYMLEDIDPSEDDVGEDDFEVVNHPSASKAASTMGTKAAWAVNTGKTVIEQSITAVNTTKSAADIVKTGSVMAGTASNVSGALAPVTELTSTTGPIGIALAALNSGLSAYSAYKTYNHIYQLQEILRNHGAVAQPGTIEAIGFCIKKKNRKLKRKGLGCVPVAGSTPVTIHKFGRYIYKKYKGTLGVKRKQHASMLWQNTLIGDTCAIAACKELLGVSIYKRIEGLEDGHLVLKQKLKSV